MVELVNVIGSNFTDISVTQGSGKVIVQSVLDNLVKGAAGNAVQNMNILLGFVEGMALDKLSPLYP